MTDIVRSSLECLYLPHQGKVSDKWESYLPRYDALFRSLCAEAIQLIEIGVQNGGSLEIWAQYFPNATRIVGCDIDPRCGDLAFDDPRIKVVVGDATRDKTGREIGALAPSPRIVIDDGSHRAGDIVRTFARYFPQIEDDGIYIAEDLHCSYWEGYQGGLFDPYSAISFFKRLADITNYEHWGIAAARRDLLAKFETRYGCVLDEDLLQQVHSVEFVNSLCVVRKRQAGWNALGSRVVVGVDAAVVNTRAIAPRATVPDQSGNRWSAFQRSPDVLIETQCAKLERLEKENRDMSATAVQQLAEIARQASRVDSLSLQLGRMEASRSWRFTAPLRAVRALVRGGGWWRGFGALRR